MQTKYLNFGSEFIHALHGSSEHFIRKWLQEKELPTTLDLIENFPKFEEVK